jgi:hypothetical protein
MCSQMKRSTASSTTGASSSAARAENRQKGLSSALRAHRKAPQKGDLLWKMLRARERPGRARTVLALREDGVHHLGDRERACPRAALSAHRPENTPYDTPH